MRTRNKDYIKDTVNGFTYSFQLYRLSTGLPLGGPGTEAFNSFSLGESHEMMIDDPVLSKSTKEVLHTVDDVIGYPREVNEFTFPNNNLRQVNTPSVPVWAWLNSTPQNLVGGTGCSVNITFPRSEAQLRADALHKFYAENDVNTLLNVIEGPQLVGTLRDIVQITGELRRKAVWKTIKRLNSLHLGYQFGVAPLVSDMKKLCQQLPNLRDRLRALRHKKQKPYLVSAVSYGKVVSVSAGSAYSGKSPPLVVNNTYWHGWPVFRVNPTRRVVVRGLDESLTSDSLFSEADSLISKLITSGPATLAWELVPFSFVVDWFVDTRGILDQLDNLIMGSRKRVLDCWFTEQWFYSLDAVKHRGGNKAFPCDGSIIATRVSRKYHRKPSPNYPVVGASGRFGKKQTGLSASLALQIGANLK